MQEYSRRFSNQIEIGSFQSMKLHDLDFMITKKNMYI